MSVIQELISLEKNGTLSFGNYLLDSKKKVVDFEVQGDLYNVKTFHEITRLEKNGNLLYESLPGSSVHQFHMDDKKISFYVYSKENLQVTLELSPDTEYKLFVDNMNLGKFKTNVSGKLSFGLEPCIEKVSVVIENA